MNQKGLAGIVIIGILVLLAVGFGSYMFLNRDIPLKPSPAPAPTPTANQDVQPQNPKNIPQAHNAFGFNLIKLLNQEENSNLFISPSSISLALSMVYNGAVGETKNAFQKALQFQNVDVDTVNKESLSLINYLKNPDPKVELSVANSVWAREGIVFQPDFLKTVKNYYNAEISSLDLNSPAAAKRINAWVSQNTKGKIPNIVDSISADIVMYLINAIYFKGSWTAEFDKSLTQNRTFTPLAKAPKQHPLMKQQGDFPYLETDDFQSVSLSYGENKKLSMYVFLPKNLENFINSLNIETWNEWMSQYENTEGTILLPKFKMEYEKELVTLLTKLGMGIVFEDKADFSGIGNGLKISAVLHKSYVDVNEEGTEAAAVTGVGMAAKSIGAEKKIFYMEVNRPFFFVISDNQTGELLFMGIVTDP